MGMPSISISFTELAATALTRGERGIIAMIIKDTVPAVNPVECASAIDVPTTLSAKSQEQIKLALMGYVNAPLRVIAYVLPADAANYTEALEYFKTVKFDYLVAPTAATDNLADEIVSYVKAERAENKLIKAVLPNTVADSEGIINYATETVYENDKSYSTEEYCARIAGIIAGTPLSISCTYAPLAELTDCTRLSKSEMDDAVDAGKLIVWFDGEKVKTARGVNSLVSLTQGKNTQFQKIKIVDTMDMIANDIRMTAEDNYLGKYANSYDNKCLLLSAIGNYFDQLVADNILASYTVEIDVDANRSYLKGKGINVEGMSDDEIKTANTGSFVFMKATLSILDAIEDIVLPITI
jgi:hypothetical protein